MTTKYKVVRVYHMHPAANLTHFLNELAEDGWELELTMPSDNPEFTNCVFVQRSMIDLATDFVEVARPMPSADPLDALAKVRAYVNGMRTLERNVDGYKFRMLSDILSWIDNLARELGAE